MKRNSKVKYIGGQDKLSKQINPLKRNHIYIVEEVCQGKFGKEWRPAVILKGFSEKVGHDIKMFQEVKTAEDYIEKTVDVSDVYNKTHYWILKNLN